MRIDYLHASKYGNAGMVAAEFKQQMAARGVVVDVHHIREVRPTERVPNKALAWRSALDATHAPRAETDQRVLPSGARPQRDSG